MKYYVVDAFTDELFRGNPAGICILDKWIDKKVMQDIASENNLSETAFVVKGENKGEYELKWFTPKAEIDLCGHATLASAYVISNYIDTDIKEMIFYTLSGELRVNRKKDFFEMNFPSRELKQIECTEDIITALGVQPVGVFLSRDLFIVLESEDDVKKLTPDFEKLKMLNEGSGIIVTSKGKEFDFVSRCFYPKLGVNEDPVTGSAHSNLIPFWSNKLNKRKTVARQLSSRGGTLYCEYLEDRVLIGGEAKLYMVGDILV